MVPQINPDLRVKNILRLERHNWVTGTGMARISKEEQEIRMKVYIGNEWSENKHEVCFLDETGDVVLVKQITHTITGFRQNRVTSSRPPAGYAHRWVARAKIH
jgi:hypothetical protein